MRLLTGPKLAACHLSGFRQPSGRYLIPNHRALPVKRDPVEFLTTEGASFDDLQLDDSYYK